MIYRPLGNTGKEISAIGIGCMRFYPEEYKKGPEKPAEILLRARELGINYFDTAPYYCDDHSEDIVGYAISQMKEKPYVSTKCGLGMAKTADEAYAWVEKSLRRLKMDKITVYNLWCIKTMEEYREMIRPGGMYDGILRAKEEGLIEHICCSVHIDGKGLAEIVADGRVESVTLGYNALNFAYRREGIEACYDAGLGVVIMNPLAGGLLPQHPDKFGFIRNSPEETIVQASLRFLLGQREITAALPGPANIAELEECVSAVENVQEVTRERLAALSKQLTRELDTLCTGCAYCDSCPEGIPVPEFMEAYNMHLLQEEPDALLNRLKWQWNLQPELAAKCTRCGVCEKLCTQKLPIINRLAEIVGLI